MSDDSKQATLTALPSGNVENSAVGVGGNSDKSGIGGSDGSGDSSSGNDGNGGNNEGDSSTTDISSFEKAVQFWSTIDLPSLQKSLDAQGIEIQDFQKNSLISRKELATKTKTFKKLEDQEKLKEIKALLKDYQNEIDNLTKKNKSIETIFFTVYRAIVEAPDPKPLLEISLNSINDLSQLEFLKKENTELKNKLLNCADYDQLKSSLAKTERNLQKLMDTKVKAKESEMQALIDEKTRNWKSKESEYQESLQNANKEIEELKIAQQVIQLKLNSQSDALNEENVELTNKATNLIELEMLTRDAESAKSRVLQLEKRNEELRYELSTSNSEVEKEKIKKLSDSKISELESENALLVARLEHERNNVKNLKTEKTKKIESLTREITQLNQEVTRLRERVAAVSDYDELKKELDVLKEIEFGELSDTNDNEENIENNQSNNKLDSIMIQRNRKLNNEIVEYRSKHEELLAKYKELESKCHKSTMEIKNLQELNSRLENDLMNLQGVPSNNGWDSLSMVSGISKLPTTSSSRNGKISPATSIAGSIVDGQSSNQQESSILPIITQQRDRFRSRNKELEDESKKQFSKIVELKRDLNNLKNDNKELYERIRYLSSYSQTNQQPKLRSSNIGYDPEARYKDSYERELHPIEQFRIKESQRISSNINPFERIYISIIRTVLSTKLSRYLFAAYCLGLHCVIMIMFVYSMDMHMNVVADVSEGGSTGGVTDGGAVKAIVNSHGDTVGNFVPDNQ